MTETPTKQRLDRWLWCARMFKTRTLSAKAVTAGPVRVNEVRIGKPAFGVTPGDVITFVRARQIMTVRIEALADRRGSAPEAQTLYEDLTPPPPKVEDKDQTIVQARREPGAGRPTKKERRSLTRLQNPE